MADRYTVSQAAQILGLSERRVRQLVSQGKLPADRDTSGALLLSQAAVNNERKARRKLNGSASGRKVSEARRAAAAPAQPGVDVEELASAVAAAVGKSLEGQIELTRRAETLVRQELDQERARSLQLEQRLAEAEADAERLRKALSEAPAPKKRRLFRREA